MPKSPISYVMKFSDPDLIAKLQDKHQGFELDAKTVDTLSVKGKTEYEEYMRWVHAPKK